MPIYTDGPIIRQNQTLEEFETPLGDYLGAKFEQALDFNPLNLAADARRFREAQDDVVGNYADPFTGFALGELKVQPKPRISADEIKLKSEQAGVQIDIPAEGLTADATDILIERRRRQMVQNDAINRSPDGARSVAGFGVQLGASLLDPLNIGLAFVPVVSQARYASMLAKSSGALGRAGVRAGIGVAEGTIGVAAFEPLAYTMHQSLQDDYSAVDSLINIAFGSVLGGGLHVVGGATKEAVFGRYWEPDIPPAPRPRTEQPAVDGVDYSKYDTPTFQRIRDLPEGEVNPARFDPNSAAAITEAVSPQTREVALRTAAAQGADGRVVDVEAIVKADPMAVMPESKSSMFLKEWINQTLLPTALRGERMASDIFWQLERYLSSEKKDFQVQNIDLKKLKPTQEGEDILNDSSRETARVIGAATTLDDISRREDVLPILIDENGTIIDGHHRYMAAMLNGEKSIAALVPVSDGTGKILNLEDYAKTKITPTENSGSLIDQIQSAIQRQQSPESVRVADPKASEAATERLSSAPKSESLADAEADLARGMEYLNEQVKVIKSRKIPEQKQETLLMRLQKIGGISISERLDVTGNNFAPGGYNPIFRKNSRVSLKGAIESGDLDDFLPYEMRLSAATDEAFDSTEAYDYIAERIRNGEKVLPFEVEQEMNFNNYLNELQVFDDAITSAEQLSAAARAAAICDLRA